MKLRSALVLSALTFSFLAVSSALKAQETSGPPSKEDQETAVGCLRSINTSEAYYAKEYQKGYSSTLAALGVPPDGVKPSFAAAALLDNSLAGGKRNNYVFSYTSGVADAAGKIGTYTVTVRPAKWQKGVVSIFTDQTGVIHWTKENRAATAKDPTIDSLFESLQK